MWQAYSSDDPEVNLVRFKRILRGPQSFEMPSVQKLRKKGAAAKVTSLTTSFENGDQVQKALSDPSPDHIRNGTLTAILENMPLTVDCSALNNLRISLKALPKEFPLSSNDARLRLLDDWLDRSPGAPELFELWDKSAELQVRSDQSAESPSKAHQLPPKLATIHRSL